MISDAEESARRVTHRPSRQEKRARTRSALLDAAERLWAERGIHGASLDEIASQAGLTKGAVYSNFASKSELVLALLERCIQGEPDVGGGATPDAGRSRRGAGTDPHPPREDMDRPRRDPRPPHAETGRPHRATDRPGPERCPTGRPLSEEEIRKRALLAMELWLFAMRDFSAGWRLADWYQERRDKLAEGLSHGTEEMSAQDRASLALAIDFGLSLQHLLDPDRVPAALYGSGIRLILGSLAG